MTVRWVCDIEKSCDPLVLADGEIMQLEGFDAELVGENVPFHFAPGMDSQVSQEMDFMGSHPDEEFDTGEMWSRWSETQQDHTYHH